MSNRSPLLNVIFQSLNKITNNMLRDFGEIENLQVSPNSLEQFVSKTEKKIYKSHISRDVLNGKLKQDVDNEIKDYKSWKLVTKKKLDQSRIEDLEFANRIVKHSKSNAIVLVKDKQMLSSGVGQTSRVDALKFAIEKAKTFNFDLEGSVMASDAFFPFPDCVEIAGNEGINAVIQPGGSLKDQLSIDYCDENNLAMVFTGVRHFKH